MRLWIHRYALVPRRALSPIARAGVREGALLRTEAGGFADIHPWPELGDAPLDEQLALLARGDPTMLARASLELAALDAEARMRGASLFAGLTIPESHWPGSDPPDGFDTVKIKGDAPVPDGVRVRIDFNATLSGKAFLDIARTLPRERVDFVEDPCVYSDAEWRDLRARGRLRLAHDLRSRSRAFDACDVLVVKPALHGAQLPSFDREIVVTSYMDHPVGQFGAAYVAATHEVSRRCGLMTHVLYEPDAFIESIGRDGARLRAPHGIGIGFDDLLESVPWSELT